MVLVLEEDHAEQQLIHALLRANGYDVAPGGEDDATPAAFEVSVDIVIASGTPKSLEVLAALRRDRIARGLAQLPAILLTSREAFAARDQADIAGDAYIAKPVRPPELVARLRSLRTANVDATAQPDDRRRLQRGGRHDAARPRQRRSRREGRDLLTEAAFAVEYGFESRRADMASAILTIAHVDIFELAGVRDTLGSVAVASILREIVALIGHFDGIRRIGLDPQDHLLLLVAGGETEARDLLCTMARTIVAHRFHSHTEPLRLTPIVGFATRTRLQSLLELRRRSEIAMTEAALHLDLEPVVFAASMDEAHAPDSDSVSARIRRFVRPAVLPLQLLATITGSLVLPFVAYLFLAAHGIDITAFLYIGFVIVLALTSIGICWESILAYKKVEPATATVYPPASAIIAAYLPNEVATIVETVEAFLAVRYAGTVQIVLAYNTPRPLPMEDELRAIAERDPRLVLLRVHDSTSKAQNVNAALRVVRGTFTGVFDADHKPDPDSFTRAWNWLASGYDIVQGRCLIRNADDSLMARLVAVEFESIYAVSHPGRTRMHGFGLFGGSNGYWKTDLLRQTRMHRFMLTEDIDSSLRVITAGYRIATDRQLISRELAPITTRSFWYQRLRWAQGWFQVSLKHIRPALRSPHLSVRQKFGMLHLLVWRECYVWASLQVLPILAFWIFVRHDRLNYFIPVFVFTTILTTIAAPVQLWATFRLAHPEIRRHRSWFVVYLLSTFFFFSELKSTITRLAHLKELMRERAWRVTPRAAAVKS